MHAGRREAQQVLRTALSAFFADQIPNVSAAITFFVLLALFPAIAAFVSLYGLFADVHEAREHLAYLRGILPERGLDVIGEQMIRIAALQTGKLSIAFALGLAVSLWSANAGASALVDGLNTAYEIKNRRSYLSVALRAFAFTFAALLLSIVMFALAALPVFWRAFPEQVGIVLDTARWIGLLVLALLSLIVVYRFGPDENRARWMDVIPGAVVAVILWIGVSALYSLYVADLANYDRTYGPLGAVVGFLMWIWLTLMVILFGAELNAAAERMVTRKS